MDLQRRSTGTTTIAVTYDGGVILGVDALGNKEIEAVSVKIFEIVDNVFMCFVGNRADCQFILNDVRHFLRQHKCQLGPTSVMITSCVVCCSLNNYKATFGRFLQAEFIIAGWNKDEGGQLYYFPIHSPMSTQKFILGGSGSIYLTGLFDYAWRKGMTEEETKKFVVDAISIATIHECSSSKFVNIVMINAEGVTIRRHPCNIHRWLGLPKPRDSLLDIFHEQELAFVASQPLPDLGDDDDDDYECHNS